MSATPEMPLVSIVLPVYNGERYFAESLQSCLDQTYDRWELIVVDDASTDATADIVAAFASQDSRIRYVRHEVNQRLPGALNTGFALSRGDLLTWTSCDNRYRPRALAEMVGILDAHPDVDFVYSDVDMIDEAGHVLYPNTMEAPLQLIQMYDGVACFLYRRSVFERVGDYAQDLFLAEDYDFFLRVLAAGCTMYPLHMSLYEYRLHSGSLTEEYRGRTFAAAERALLRNLPAFDSAGNELRGELFIYLVRLAAWRGDYAAAAGYMATAVRLAPVRLLEQAAHILSNRVRKLVSTAPTPHATGAS